LGGVTAAGQSDLPAIKGDRLRLSLHWALLLLSLFDSRT
jgi:hypothetical protein